MAKELPYFKFNVSEWLLGRISDENYRVQGLFLSACCHYWHKECLITLVELNKKLGKTNTKLLVNYKFIFESDGDITIPFLDEQRSELTELQRKRIEAGRRGGKAKGKQSLIKTEANPKHLEVDKIKKRKDKIKEDLFSSQVWKEGIAKLNKCKLIEVEKYLVIFLEGQELDDNLDRDLQEVKKHFRAWFKKQDFKSDKPKRTIAL